MSCGLGGAKINQNTPYGPTSNLTFRNKHMTVNLRGLFSSFVYVIISYMHFMANLYIKSTKKSILDLIFCHFLSESKNIHHFIVMLPA